MIRETIQNVVANITETCMNEDVYVTDEWNNPVEYYNKYGNNAVFKADGKTKGEIYFCSVGNTSNSGTKYKTLGYKMSVKDENGNILQNVNYKFGGCQLRFVRYYIDIFKW